MNGDLVASHVRRLVADSLGVDVTELTPDVSLPDDLAVDSLDLVELTLALEEGLCITLPEGVMGSVRSFADLVGVVESRLHERGEVPAFAADPVFVWARTVPPDGGRGGVERADWFTPYLAETISEDVRRTGPGARVIVAVAGGEDERVLARVHRGLARLEERGVGLLVHPRSQPEAAAARATNAA